MDWYPHHISDYDADTLHLTLAEDGAYSRLLRWYYENERALPDDDVALAAICRVGIDEWRSIAPKIRALFVTRDSRGGHGSVLGQKRCDSIILAQNKKRKDWKARQKKLRKNNVLDPVTRDTPVSHASRGEERKEKKEEAKASPKENSPTLALVPSEDHDDAKAAVKAYNETAAKAGLPQVQKLTDQRRAKLRRRLKDCDGLDGWQAALDRVASIPGLCGDNDRGWRADLDFLCQEKSFTKLMEGGYDHWGRASQQPDRMNQEFDRIRDDYAESADPFR